MGGYGSGRWNRGRRRATVEELPRVDARDLRLAPGQQLEAALAGVRLPVAVDWCPCPFGGVRPWLLCPALGCGRRRGALYVHDGRLRCRACLGLRYRSQYVDRAESLRARAEKIERRLGWNGDPAVDWLPLPVGMRQATFDRLMARAGELHDRADALDEERDRRLFAMTLGRLVARYGP